MAILPTILRAASALLPAAALAAADPALAPKSEPSLTISPRPEPAMRPLVDPQVEKGNQLYFQGELTNAAAAYEKAAVRAPTLLDAWLNGAVVLEEIGKRPKAVEWLRKAAALAPNDARILTELGWAELRNKDFKSAESHLRDALAVDAKLSYAVIGLGRAKLAQKRLAEAADDLARAQALDPLNDLAHFYAAQALEAKGDFAGAVEAYKKAAMNDSYFVENRYALGRAFMRLNRFYEAATQFAKVIEADPANAALRQLKQKMQQLIPKGVPPDKSKQQAKALDSGAEVLERPMGNLPLVRVGIGTSAMGKPLQRWALQFQASTPFSVVDEKTLKTVASGPARELWQVRFAAPGKKAKFEVLNPLGEVVGSTKNAVLVRPDLARGGTVLLQDIPYGRGTLWSGIGLKHLRGEVELSVHPSGKGFRIVNLVDLESYTHGVLSAEMPITSPLEALKSQAVIARTHGLFIKNVTRRHAKDGYDLCDGQHCQVYTGINAESERSRAVVNATRARIVAFKGKIAQALFSSNCGGHSQAGRELTGWGEVKYWESIRDAAPDSLTYPDAPWALRWWLRSRPPAYCRESGHVYPSHYRWTRVVKVKDITDKINRNYKVGRILGLRTLRRARSGHLNSVLIKGSRKDVTMTKEINIRSMLGLGSQRSALFVVDTETGADGNADTLIFHGAGWGHGVGLCQSGAMGRAEKGHMYDSILKAYYPGTELGNLRY
ncbi:MAG: SpoIID/LytB domain-containing protein [Elusimicrobia bacterium]|nr:SpoIID/LytB domain-containing protein [Elusimicrobiota bacterium]